MTATAFTDGELVNFRLFGSRSYVRAVDVIGLVERREPNFSALHARFLRPLSCGAVIGTARRPGAAAIVRVTPRSGAPYELSLTNRDAPQVVRRPDTPPRPHWALPGSVSRRRYVILCEATPSELLAVVFAAFQRQAGRRFVVRTLQLTGMTARHAELVTVTCEPRPDGMREQCLITRNGRVWCRVDMQTREPLLGGQEAKHEQRLVQGHQ